MSKKVAFLVSGINAGGTENYLLRFIQYYKKHLNVTVYCKSGKLGELETEFRDAQAKLLPYKLGYFDVLKYLELKKEFKREKYEAICDLTGSFGALPLLMAKKAGISKRVGFFRNSKEKFKKSFLKTAYNDFLTNLLPKVSTKVLSNSKTALNYFYQNTWQETNKFGVVYNGIDAKKFTDVTGNLFEELSIPTNAFVVGHVGRFNEQKNHKTIIEVALQLCKQNKDIYFVLCGKNVDVTYQDIINKNKLEDQIKLLGVRRDINKVLNTLSCFYFPSLIEGQPNALIEALVMKLPFVASNINPILETIPTEYHKQLIAPNDVVLAKEKILEIKNTPKLRAELDISTWAINYFDPKKWFELVYKEL